MSPLRLRCHWQAAAIDGVSEKLPRPVGLTALDACATAEDNEYMRYRVTIEVDEDGLFIAECPSLPGCVSQGQTRSEALANIRDAMIGYVASLKKHGEPVPPPITEEIIEVPA